MDRTADTLNGEGGGVYIGLNESSIGMDASRYMNIIITILNSRQITILTLR